MLTENFIFQFLGFIALNLVVLGTTGMIAIRLLNYKLENLTKFTLSTFLLTTTQILLTQITLGSFSILNYTNVWMLNLVIFVITLATLGKKILKNTKLPNIPKFNPWPFLIIFTPFITILLLRYTNALFQIPLEYDNVAYHLPFVVEWFKSGNLLDIYYSAYAGPLGYYPSNYELLDLWVLLPFGKDS